MSNRLADETSPYLLQHKDNPVDWWPWGEEAFAAAKRLNRPVLLSVGYAACHWCHVMAHESFESPDVAKLMNELFVNIKVDREERPDIDTIYQHALALLGEQGGWPLTMFLSPAGEPFFGGTYFPPEQRWGRPGFPHVLRRIAEAYRDEQATVVQNTTSLSSALRKMSETPAVERIPQLDAALLDQMAKRLAEAVDRVHGGIGSAPKFPQTTILELLWRGYLRNGNHDLKAAVEVSLDRMAQGGIYDHVGGGFARYSTDEKWLVPHFEKMLYDNALLIDLMTEVWRETRSRLYAMRVRETIGWVLREMLAEGGAFAASLDADSEGEEGKFYVWQEAEIDRLLGSDAADFKTVYGVSAAGNWEGHNILNRSHRPGLRDADGEADLDRLRYVLLEARENRVRPGWDDKVLADWNGLMIVALTKAAAAFDEPGWLLAAVRAFEFVAGAMADGERLWHAARKGKVRNAGMLEDYANMAAAALALHQATSEERFLVHAKNWAAVLDRWFWDERQGGYFQTASDGEKLITRPRSAADHATPSGNGTMVGVLARLHAMSGEDHYRVRAEALVVAFAPELGRNFFPLSSFLNGFDFFREPVQVVIVGRPSDAATADFRRALWDAAVINAVFTIVTDTAGLPANHPAKGKTSISGRPTAYVCVGPTCSLPVTDVEAFTKLLPAP
jgi:uncharacterized protein YyaL (SSP411 family)